MSIRPVDMQIVVQKTQEVHHAKQTVVSKLDNELLQAQSRVRDDNIKRQHTVNQMERSELKQVKNDREDEENKRKRRYKPGQSNRESEEEEALNKKVSVSGTHFDMKV